MRKMTVMILASIVVSGMLSGCGSGIAGEIFVISREDGSGTRGAFVELFGVEQTDETGRKVDCTIDTAEITNSTGVMLTSVADNRSAIGYVSLGSLNDTVKALKIDGVEASAENVRNGSYPVKRPFNIVVGPNLSVPAQDFVEFMISDEGQMVVEESGYISSSSGPYRTGEVFGEVTVSGSSSVSPVMEKLAEAYMAVNGGVNIVLQISDSTTGISDAAGGLCDIGMASRELKDSEVSAGLTAISIAADGIAVIVHPENTLSGLTTQQVCDIYTGGITAWDQLGD